MNNPSDLPNYNVFIIIMMGVIFLLSAISFINITRNILTSQIQDPYIKSQIIRVQYLCGYVMVLIAFTLLVFMYLVSKK